MDPLRLGKYEIGAKIGQGAMGNVHRAHDPILNRDVAIKTMSAGVDSDDELRRRFHREAQSAARLNHPNIITIYDFGEEQGRMYIAMELLEGKDLKQVITRERPLSLDAKLDIMDQVCDGLAFAHARGVIHRDLKPANIHLQQDGKVKIMDFGLARVSTATELTGAGMMLGTPNYMSPEQVRGDKASTRSDVFSLGVVFYELLAGRKAFDADSMAGVLFQVMQKEPEPLESIRAELGPISTVIQRALAKDPTVRFPDATSLRDALREARRSVRADAVRPRPPSPPKAPGELPSGAGTLVRPAADGTTLSPATDATRAIEPSPASGATPIPAATYRPSEATQPAATTQAAATAPPSPTDPGDGHTVAMPAPEPTVAAATAPPRAFRPAAADRGERSRTTGPSPVVPAPTTPRPGLSTQVVVGGTAALGLAVAVGLWLAFGRNGSEPDPVPAVTVATSTLPPATTLPPPPPTTAPDPRLAEAEGRLREKDYRAALTLAEQMGEAGGATAKRVADEARRALRAADEIAARFERALKARDRAGATQALTSLLAEDPRRPGTADLLKRLTDLAPDPTPRPSPTAPPTTRPIPPPAIVTTTTTLAPVTTTTLPQPPVTVPAQQSEAAARQAIRGVLDEYRAAFERRDADALRAVQPGVDYDAMKKVFASVTGYLVRVDVKEVTVKGDEGRATCIVTYEPQPKPSQKLPPQRTVFHLRRRGDVWLIERLERR